ncbi:LPXTG-domain-containing protein cell wall anchor domain [Bacillus mycoides]|uniref:LPXTG-domain-containing protein cell wall anchor domain n=1 Tax=Bacillus mycoides TaxID=1405 RepID=A0ABC9QWL2_BACMY|nr:LPXTG-domain-containing protein cell wall anchor domain [Bacillus mycoides]
MQLLKVDGENPDKTLEGAVFILQDSKGKKISEHKSDKNGLIEVKDVPFGAYSFVEKQAPTGYVLTKESIPFSISEQGTTIMLTAKNKQITGELKISKVDITDGNNKLPYGKYTYKETFAPEGYLLNEKIFSFEIKEDGQIIKHTMKDQKKPTPPTPEKPQLEQTPNKVETYLPTTGSKAENPYIRWIGLVCVALGLIGAVFVVRNRKKVQ